MTYVPAGACWSWQEWTPTILFLEIRAGRTQPGVGVSPGWLHDLHHFREQMMLARMIWVIISDNSTHTHRHHGRDRERQRQPHGHTQLNNTAQTDRENYQENIQPSCLLWRPVRNLTLNVIKLENSESIFSFIDWSSDKMISCCQLTRIIF